MGFLTSCLVFGYGFRNSYNKLTGQRPNEQECERAGIEYVPAKLY